MKSVLLDFSNVRVGGGLLVASATLEGLSQADTRLRYPWLEQAEIWISPNVRRNLSVPETDLPGTVRFKETTASALAVLKPARRDYDVRFTLFGPTYTGRLARREITGFAEVTMLVKPRDFGLAPEPFSIRKSVSGVVKRNLAKRSDLYVTETSAVADRLSQRFAIRRDRILVVPNRPHPLFTAQPILPAKPGGAAPGELHLAFPTRLYPHKNLAVIEPVARLLQQRAGKRLVVHTTLRDHEWEAFSPSSQQWMQNHGESPAAKVLDIYRQVDAVFFPSLLEASSVTPLEANVLGLPLLASDRDFVRASAAASELFEPTDAVSVADALVRFDADKEGAWERAQATALAYRERLAASSRTENYLDLVDRELREVGGDAA